MSLEDVKQVIGRAVIDAEFRELLFTDPDSALQDYDLDEEELAGLKKMEKEKFSSLADALEERVSRAGIMLQQMGSKRVLSQDNLTKLRQAMREFSDDIFLFR